MQLQLVYVWAKKVHKWVMWGVVALGSWMMLSGYLMHQELEGDSLLSPQIMSFMRLWHNKVSQYFLVVLLLQMATGLAMWGIPKILQARIKPSVQ